jgi:hypothetical protein
MYFRMMLDGWPTARFRHESHPKCHIMDWDAKTEFPIRSGN